MRRFAKLIVFLCIALTTDAGRTPKERAFHFEYSVRAVSIPAGTLNLDVWLPVPHDDAWQRVGDLRVQAPSPYRIASDGEGNQMLHIRVPRPRDGTLPVTLSFNAIRKEHLSQPGSATGTAPESAAAMAKWLLPDRLVPLDNTIRKWARKVVADARATTDLAMAHAIYNHVVATVKYDKSGKGWGRGDIYYACDQRRGNCTDFHAVFIGYARAVGIPARFAIGFPLPAERGDGKIAGYHCWAEFYAKGIGWVPVDASEAAKNPDKREYFFGAHDENRIEFTRGRDLILTPPQHSEPLNYFIYPYIEADGKPYTVVETAYSYSDRKPN